MPRVGHCATNNHAFLICNTFSNTSLERFSERRLTFHDSISDLKGSCKVYSVFEMPEMPGELGRIDLGDITPHNIKLLRKVNTVVFPVSYHDKFYKV